MSFYFYSSFPIVQYESKLFLSTQSNDCWVEYLNIIEEKTLIFDWNDINKTFIHHKKFQKVEFFSKVKIFRKVLNCWCNLRILNNFSSTGFSECPYHNIPPINTKVLRTFHTISLLLPMSKILRRISFRSPSVWSF